MDTTALSEPSEWSLSNHQARQLSEQVKAAAGVESSRPDQPLVVEALSPPRFAPIAQPRGFTARSIDLTLGTDLSCPKNRARLKAELRDTPPVLLVLCPPCTNERG